MKKIYILGSGQFANFTYHLLKDIKQFKFSGFIVKEQAEKKNYYNEDFFFKTKK